MLGIGIVLSAVMTYGFYGLTIAPAREAARLAQSWMEVPAVIIAVSSHEEDGYRCRFAYQVAGRSYESSRQALKSWKVVTSPRRVGQRTVCFVDRADPSNAVLDRDASIGFDDVVMMIVALMSWAFLTKALLVRFSLVRVRVDIRTAERLTYKEMSASERLL